MITDLFYATLAGTFGARQRGFEQLYLALGSGMASWDQSPPVYQRDITALVNEVARKQVALEQIAFLDSNGNPIEAPSPRIEIVLVFNDGEGEGSLRECGLFGGDVDGNAGSGVLLSYFTHARIDKGPGMSLHRRISLDFTATPVGSGQAVTRYLGNSATEELHDLENETGACQLNEIRSDRRVYFSSPEQAQALGYDYCAFCFGRELSQR